MDFVFNQLLLNIFIYMHSYNYCTYSFIVLPDSPAFFFDDVSLLSEYERRLRVDISFRNTQYVNTF